MKITPEMLKAHHACKDQYNLFLELFPDGVEITEELCVKYAGEFQFYWAGYNLLDPAQCKAYNKAVAEHRKAYYKAMAPHQKTYDEAINPHQKTYDEALAREFFRCSQL